MRRFNPEKELYKIQYGNRNKVLYGIILLLLIISIGSTYALYQVRYSKRIIYTKVAPFSNKDINILAIYLDDKPTDTFPKKGSFVVFDRVDCDNGSTATFDTINWKINLKAEGKDKCAVYFVKEKEGTPNAPELYQGLIPVTYTSDGTVLVADGTKDWYNYDDKKWANAVLVDSSNYSKYVIDGEYQSNTEIPMSEILQMYVWIPRYKYQLFNANYENIQEQMINIKFESGTESTGDVTCTINDKGEEICENAMNGKWYTHPAFTFGKTDLPGIWVGKFESGNNINDIKIVPNVTSIVNTTISDMFNASRNIETEGKYNLNKSVIDTHMMKNTEWGCIAYLTLSKYGRCDGNGVCTEPEANGSYYTGYYGTSYSWSDINSGKASTTGNKYGIYDMNGCNYEYMMAVILNNDGSFSISNTDFIKKPNSKYYDSYLYNTVNNISSLSSHLGDALKETYNNSLWYKSIIENVPRFGAPWFIRGYALQGGMLALTANTGVAYPTDTFRVVITAQDGNE